MIKKFSLQAIISISLFFSIWFFMSKINWTKKFKIETIYNKTEEKLGDFFWKSIKNSETEINNDLVIKTVDSFVNKICIANDINAHSIKVHIVKSEEINAFALPDSHLIIYTGLILQSKNPEELCGVICHEIAHIQLNHVMKKLVKEVGFSVLASMARGNNGSEITNETIKMLTSTAFDRKLEKEADIKAVDYLIKSKINPIYFADFLYMISESIDNNSALTNWLSTHPDSKIRAEYIIDYCNNKKNVFLPISSIENWKKLKTVLSVEFIK